MRGRGDLVVAEDMPDRRCTDAVTEAGELAVDPPVAPRRIVGGHRHHEFTDDCRGRWPPRAPRRVGPVTRHPSAVPPQQGLGGDDPSLAESPWQRLRDRAQQSPVIVFDSRSQELASQHCELVAQHDDLEVLRPSRPDRQTDEPNDEAIQGATHEPPSARVRAGQPSRPSFRHPQATFT